MFEFSLKGLKGKEEIFTHVNSPLEFLTTKDSRQIKFIVWNSLPMGEFSWRNSHSQE